MPRALRAAVLMSWLLAGLSVLGNPAFVALTLIEFTSLDDLTWFVPATAIVCVVLVGLGIQTSYDIGHRSRSAPTLASVQGVAGILIALAGLATIGLRMDSIVRRGIFSGYPEAMFFMFWALTAFCAYGYVAYVVRRNAPWFSRAE